MTKNILKTSIISTIAIGLLAIGSVALADTIGGNLSTGLGGAVGNGVVGVVVSPPIANPPGGVYTLTQSVTLTADGATGIYYTTNGDTPSCSTGNLYSGAISISVSEPIEAISCYPNNASSTVASYLYAIVPPSNNSNTGNSNTGGGGGGGGGGGSTSSGGSSLTSAHPF